MLIYGHTEGNSSPACGASIPVKSARPVFFFYYVRKSRGEALRLGGENWRFE